MQGVPCNANIQGVKQPTPLTRGPRGDMLLINNIELKEGQKYKGNIAFFKVKNKIFMCSQGLDHEC